MNQSEKLPKRKSIRLKEYDYSQAGYYFITICTKDKECLFGEVSRGKAILNEYGMVVEDWLNQIIIKYPHCDLDCHVIMPNHVHFILIINECRGRVALPAEDEPVLSGGVTPPLPTLGNIIGYYKYQTTKRINQIRKMPGTTVWQRNYYEYIIRNDRELHELRKYIDFNPLKWDEDEYYTG